MPYELFVKRVLLRKPKKALLDYAIRRFLAVSSCSERGRESLHDLHSAVLRIGPHQYDYTARITLDKRLTLERWVRLVEKFKRIIGAKRWKKVPWEITRIVGLPDDYEAYLDWLAAREIERHRA